MLTNMEEHVPLAHAGMTAQFDLQKQYYAEGRVFTLQIESTLQCPQMCKYCYAESTPKGPQGLSSTKIRRLIDDAASVKVQMIDWLGGDPLMRRDWQALCSYTTRAGLTNNIWTSGIPLAKPEVAARAVKRPKEGLSRRIWTRSIRYFTMFCTAEENVAQTRVILN